MHTRSLFLTMLVFSRRLQATSMAGHVRLPPDRPSARLKRGRSAQVHLVLHHIVSSCCSTALLVLSALLHPDWLPAPSLPRLWRVMAFRRWAWWEQVKWDWASLTSRPRCALLYRATLRRCLTTGPPTDRRRPGVDHGSGPSAAQQGVCVRRQATRKGCCKEQDHTG